MGGLNTPDLTAAEGILLWHAGWALRWAVNGQALHLERYRTLPAEHQKTLAAAAVRLRERLVAEDGAPDDLLVVLACLAVGGRRRRPDQETWLDRGEAIPDVQLRDAAYIYAHLAEAVERYRRLPAALRRLLERQLGGPVLPGVDASTEEALVALGRIGPVLPPSDSPIEGTYGRLAADEIPGLVRNALELVDAGERRLVEAGGNLLHRLVCLRPDAPGGFHDELIAHGVLYPSELFRTADANTRDRLLALIETTTNSLERSHAIEALAWIGDEVVQRAFAAWRAAPPAWRAELYVDPADYAPEAGWELTESGERRDLHYATCYRLKPDGDAVGPVTVVTPHEGQCGWCGRGLTTLFEIDLSDGRLVFLEMTGNRLRIAACERCTGFAMTFTDVDFDGGSVWSPTNVRPDLTGRDGQYADVAGMPQRRLALGPARGTPFEAQVLEDGQSQIGGHPTWWQDAEYPRCPRCVERMPCLGQLLTSDLGEPAEGTWYACLCAPCRVAAVVYRQS
jgi:hypothetical protein